MNINKIHKIYFQFFLDWKYEIEEKHEANQDPDKDYFFLTKSENFLIKLIADAAETRKTEETLELIEFPNVTSEDVSI